MTPRKKTILLLLLSVAGFTFCYGFDHLAPRIIEQPSDIVVARHQPLTLQCQAEGIPAPNFTWFKDGIPLISGGRRVVLPAGGLFFLRTAHARRDSDAGTYWCEATNAYGTARSRNATLRVAVLRDEFRLEPADTKAVVGDTALLECSPPRGIPEPQVVWKKDGQLLSLEDDSRISIVDGGNLVIQDLTQKDIGRYQCIASNAAGRRESASAALRVYVKPFMIAGPADAVAIAGSSIIFQCKVGGDPVPDVLWRRTAGGGNMPLARLKVLEDRSLELKNIVLEDEGEYICDVDNAAGEITASGILTVHSPPVLDVRPIAQSVEVGSDAFYECSANGSPTPTLFWSIEGNHTLIFPGMKWNRFKATIGIDGKSRLTLENVDKDDSGTTVVCSAVNLVGAITGRAKLLVTSEEDRPPPIIMLGPSNQTLPLKSIAEFPCSAVGAPDPIISWYHRSIPVLPSHKVNISESGTLTIKNLGKEDSGIYTCVASSKNGKYVWSATLRVDSPTNPNINFFRGPDLSSLPGSPGRPIIRNMTESSVTIAWSQNNKIGSSAIMGFQIEMFGGGFDSWTTVARGVQETFYTKKDLPPASHCVFFVRAENSHGLSPPSMLSETVLVGGDSMGVLMSNEDGAGTALIAEARASLQADEVVQILEVIPVDSTMVKLAWETINSFNIDGFYIYYRPLDAINVTADEYSMQTVLHSGSASGFSISNLKKYTTYEFFLVPFYRNIDGRPSNSKIARTREDVPTNPPTQLEAYLLNSSSVYLKWKAPPLGTHNGVIQYYRVVIKESGNGSAVVHNVTVPVSETADKIVSVTLGNLHQSVAYWLQIAAATSAGEGPYNQAATLRLPDHMDPASKLLNHLHSRDAMDQNPQQIESSDLFSEIWFIALLGSMITVMLLLLLGTFLIRKHHLISKKSALPNLYDPRSTGTSLVTQLNLKNAVGMPHTLTTSYNQNSISKTDSLLWMDNRPGSWRQSSKELQGMSNYSHVNESGFLPEYDKINPQMMPDYAEVDASLVTYRKSSFDDSETSPAAYASVTVIGNGKQNTGSKGWIHMCTGSKSKVNEDREEEDEVYPANNGGYYNRNVFSDTYFSTDRSNVFQFSDIPQSEDAQSHMQMSQNFNRPIKERTYSLPQTPCGTIKRSHRLQMIRSQNIEKLKDMPKERINIDLTNAYHEIRTQENPTFGLDDDQDRNANISEDDKHYYGHVQPMKLINHHYSRTRPSPTGKSALTSFSTLKNPGSHGKPEYHSTTRSEPGNHQ